MPSTLRCCSPITPTLGVLALVTAAMPTSLPAQQPAAQSTVPVTISVRPTVEIRSVAPGVARAQSAIRVVVPSVVEVRSNLPYRVAVRLARAGAADEPTDAVRVLVRSADGTFEPLDPGASVVTAVSRTGGERAHEVLCRVETSAAPELLDARRCALVYELSAEHQDALVRATATGSYGLRTVDPLRRDAATPLTMASRGF